MVPFCLFSAELQAAFEEKQEEVDELTAMKMSIESDLLNTSELTAWILTHHEWMSIVK